jgi:hypothetical protein
MFMKKSPFAYLTFATVAVLAGACGTKSNTNSPCKTGAEACYCYANHTCDDGLSCVATLCLDLSALGGAGSFLGSAGESAMSGSGGANVAGSSSAAGGNANTGGSMSAGGSISSGGSIGNGGSMSAGGSISNGGSISTGGSSGSGSLFPPNPAGCARVTTCPSCCQTAGVFALDSLALDATSRYVTAFDVSASAATAEFDFATSDEVGAIFFHFSTPQSIGALSISGLATGGALEIALVRASGQDGCIYPVVGSALSSTPSSCWGLGAGPFAALPADQIEVRVRSLASGRAALSVSSVQYGP